VYFVVVIYFLFLTAVCGGDFNFLDIFF